MTAAPRVAIDVSGPDGIVRVTGSGLWTVPFIQQHFREFGKVLSDIRRSGGQVRVLVDLRDSAVQTAEAVAELSAATERAYLPQDRVAVMCVSALVAMQVRRASRVDQMATFDDVFAALSWLRSDKPVPSELWPAARATR